MMRKLVGSTLLCAALLAPPAMAAPLAYDEAAWGDISEINRATFDLGAGTNTITGKMQFVTLADGKLVVDLDPFFFTFASNLQLASLTLQSSFLPLPETISDAQLRWGLSDNIGNDIAGACQHLVWDAPCPGQPVVPFLPASGGALFADVMPLAVAFDGGVFAITMAPSWSGVEGFKFGGELSYTLTFNVLEVRSVPEPATLLLLGIAVGGLALVRRRAR